jgi:fatty-acyl-CoA synthase
MCPYIRVTTRGDAMPVLPALNVGLGSWPGRRARIMPRSTALIYGDRCWTYAEFAERTARVAAALRELGVAQGDRVAYVGVNHPAFLECLCASGLLGAVFVPLNPRLAAAEIAYMLDDSGAEVVVHGAEMSAVVAEALPETSQVRHVVAVEGEPVHAALTYQGLLDGEADGPVGAGVSLDDPAMIIYTSGTTGRPKGAVITHGNVTFNMMNQLAHVDVLSSDRALAVAPLFHTAGLNQVTMPTLFKGGSVVITPRFDPGELLETVQRQQITAFPAVPTMLQMIVDHPAWDGADVSSLRHVIYGGSPVIERVARAWLERGVPLLQGYGMTESSPGVTLAVADGAAQRPVSTGVPHFFTDLAVDVDGVPTPAAGHTGEALVRGPNVFTEYWNRPEETKHSFVDGVWFRTGDAVRVEDDGWTHVVDRIKDMIISGGENVYPAEVEAVLITNPAVAACALVGVPDERWGEVGFVFVALRQGATLGEDDVTAYLRDRLARYKVPKYVRFVDSIPVNATGKIRRVELRKLAAVE